MQKRSEEIHRGALPLVLATGSERQLFRFPGPIQEPVGG
jgi:hypothetical protein